MACPIPRAAIKKVEETTGESATQGGYNKGYYAVQDHSRSPISLPIEIWLPISD